MISLILGLLFSFYFTQALNLQVNIHPVILNNFIAKDPDYIFRYCDQSKSPNSLPIYVQSFSATNKLVVSYTDTTQNVHLLTIASDFHTLLSNHVIPGKDCRGLFAFSNGSIAVLIRRGSCSGSCSYCGPPGPCPPGDGMWFVLIQPNGTIITNQQIDDRIYDFSLGGGRLAFGSTSNSSNNIAPLYEAYYKVHSISQMCEVLQPGHEGDTLKAFVNPPFSSNNSFNPTAPVPPPGWCWGCSHSMDIRIAVNPIIQDIATVCISDAYPYQGLIFKGQTLIYKFPGFSNGATTGGLGSLISDPHPLFQDGYIISWNAPKPGGSYYTNTTELAIARIDQNGHLRGSIVWLSNTPTLFEEASHVVSFGGTSSYMLLVAWWTIQKIDVTCNNNCCVQPSVTGSINAPRSRYVALLNATDFSFLRTPQDITTWANFDERSDFFTLTGNPGAGFVSAWNSDPKTCQPSQIYSSPTNNLSIVTFTLTTDMDFEFTSSFPCAPSCIQLTGSVVPLSFPPTSANGIYSILATWNGTRPAYILQGATRYIYFDSNQWLYDFDTNPNGYLGTTFGSSALTPIDIPKNTWYIYNGSQFVLDPNIVISSCSIDVS